MLSYFYLLLTAGRGLIGLFVEREKDFFLPLLRIPHTKATIVIIKNLIKKK